MFLEERFDVQAQNKLRCLVEAEPKYHFLKAKTQTP